MRFHFHAKNIKAVECAKAHANLGNIFVVFAPATWCHVANINTSLFLELFEFIFVFNAFFYLLFT